MVGLRWLNNMLKANYILVCFFVFISYSEQIVAQKENNIWMIGTYGPPIKHSFVDFNNSIPVVDSVYSTIYFFLTNASICDTLGQLQFYTNGHVIYNRNHDSLFNTSGINPGWATTYYEPYGMGIPQGALIIPNPGNDGQYLLFYESAEFVTLDSVTSNAPINLSYSIIDMGLDGGLGGIISGSKNLIAVNDTLVTGRITGVKHGNGRDWWILVHHYNDDRYYSLLVTPNGILGPTMQNIGRPHLFERYVMQSCFSPQGDQFVIGLTVNKQTLENVVDLFDFDRCSGLLSNHREIEIPDTVLLASGCSFSPSGRWLYVSTNKNIYQYDTWDANINATRSIVSTWDTTQFPHRTYYQHLLAPDGKIYVTNWFSADFLHVINEPDLQGAACDVVHEQVQLYALNTFMMPNAANYSLGAVPGSVCDSLTSINEFYHNFMFSFSPNPNNGNFNISYFLPQNKNGNFEVYDLNGKLIYQLNLPQWSSFQKIQLPNEISSGIYNCRMSSMYHAINIKLVVVKV
jgi:hypothetical protein